MDQIVKPDYEFAGFRLDTVQQALFAPDGQRVDLPSRAFETLRHLVERAGELVEKQALMQAVWPHTVVEENNLNQCVLALRRALGETAGDRRFILTVPGRGFKFVAPVDEVRHVRAESSAAAPAAPAAAPPVDSRRAGLRRPALLALVALIAVTGALFWWRASLPHMVTVPAEYEALTDVADSVTAPAVSPDGHLLAFIRGDGPFLSSGQIWLKLLPDGEPVQLTHSTDLIFAPTFTPDGSHVAYSATQQQPDGRWDTWLVPITGGEPKLLLPNASGLSYIDAHTVLYSEFKQGLHLGIASSLDNRSQHRDVYLPAHERGMAHYSWLAPDRKDVLVVEMDESGAFRRCRLLPFDGSSSGVQVGPEGACMSAAWSTDGRWMYFSVAAGGHSHLWRQRYPQGRADQITFGPGDEEMVAVAPDGRSLLTSIGREQGTIWLHDANGERVLATANEAYAPWLSADGRRAYFVEARASGQSAELRRLDIGSGRSDTLLAGYAFRSYGISVDESQVVFSTGHGAASQVWLAPLDRRSPPRLLARAADEPAFDATGDIFFRSIGEHENTLHRIHSDGSGESKVLAGPIVEFESVAPDGKHVMVDLKTAAGPTGIWLAPVDGGQPVMVREGWWPASWSRDGKSMYIEAGTGERGQRHGRTAIVRVGADGLPSSSSGPGASGGALIPYPEDSISVAADPAVYLFQKIEIRRNIYRIPLH